MDVDTFAQCLQYIQATHSGFTVEKLIPVGAAFAGAILGFGLNYATSIRKENKTTQNKKLCCEEDIQKIRRDTANVASEVCNLCIILTSGADATHHQVPTHVSSLYLDEYFIDVAHKFNTSQRESIKMLLGALKVLNEKLPSLTDRSKSYYIYSTALLNLANCAILAWSYCEDILRGEIMEPSHDEAYTSLKLTPEQVEAITILQRNAKSSNTELNLSVD